ncbi:MAG: hypothetical protein RB191_18595 [Terriglobia bacterium]|nr:hypothetical protein [Terriglobia bacterium]
MINWTPELKAKIIEGLETKSLRKLCASDPTLPHRDTITDYFAIDADFSAKCARAREDHAEVMDDKILEVAEKVEQGTLDPKAGSVVISAYQWRASKLAPKKYGDRTVLAGDPENPLAIGLASRISEARKRDK